MASWHGGADRPIVSVCCVTYNHEAFIEDALEGILMQETNFPFEILIHDDASTDKTVDVIREYEANYPKIIKATYQTENQFSIGRRWFHYLIPEAKGKYIATCEGDDYWTDPKKLQIQVDFLEQNPGYVISGHDAFIIDDKGKQLKESKLPRMHKHDYSSEELQKGKAWLLTMSWVYRNLHIEDVPERLMTRNGDKFFTALIGRYGSSKYHDDIRPAAYRVHSGGIWSKRTSRERMEEHLNTYYWLYKYFSRIGSNDVARCYWNRYMAYALLLSPSEGLLKECLIRVCFFRQLRSLFRKFKKKQKDAPNSTS